MITPCFSPGFDFTLLFFKYFVHPALLKVNVDTVNEVKFGGEGHSLIVRNASSSDVLHKFRFPELKNSRGYTLVGHSLCAAGK